MKRSVGVVVSRLTAAKQHSSGTGESRALATSQAGRADSLVGIVDAGPLAALEASLSWLDAKRDGWHVEDAVGQVCSWANAVEDMA